jgi:toxin ParE1/3/4
MTGKPVIPTRQARQAVVDGLNLDLVEEGSEQAALGFVAEIKHAYTQLARHPGTVSPRYAYELEIPELWTWPLDRYSHLNFYTEREGICRRLTRA